MYFYFCAEFPCAVKLNGIYYGIISDAVKNIDIFEPEKTLVEIIPLNEKTSVIGFLLNQEFLTHPKNATVTDLKGGYLIKILGYANSSTFKIIAQEKYPNAIVTLFNENGTKLSIETNDCFFADVISFEVKNCKIEKFNLDGFDFISLFINEKYLLIYLINKEIKKVYSERINDYSLDGRLYTKKSYKDLAKHETETYWGFDGKSLIVKDRNINYSRNFNVETLPDKLIPYAFIEEFLVGGDYLFYLSETVGKNADKLKYYFGDFIGIMPPPKFRSIDEIGLIYPSGENLYNIEYFTFTLKNGKIDNIKKTTE